MAKKSTMVNRGDGVKENITAPIRHRVKREKKPTIKIGDKMFSPKYGNVIVEDLRGKGQNQEFAITIMDEKHWFPVNKIINRDD